ncbi:hypothetical protein KGF57_001611 [Candida theae]|uniref:Uncharacterized protein n=1 Tax=Candida theae TaxID=1198502 RepID=A0AAD5BGL1_9ASCO|nr:uncharacterized protein KGF57_001611 [Candida theae]KAI5961677.1 hypothetical protein KGF57_001611 [Candida theae]
MLATDTPFAKRLTQCACAILWCLLCGGPIFGFAALKPILIKEHVYESLCDLHPETATTPSLIHAAANDVVAKCTPQDLKLNKMFTIAAVVTNVSALLIGHVLDNFGPKVCGLIGAGFLYLASFIFIYAKQMQLSTMWSSWFDPYVMGYSFLALGGPFTFISSFQLSNSFPERSGTILAMLTGAFDASSAVFLLYSIVYTKSHGEFTLDTFFRVYLLVPIFITIAQLTVMPSESYQTSTEFVKLVDGSPERERSGNANPVVTEESALLSSESQPPRRDSIGDALKHPYEEEEYLIKHRSDPVVGILHGYSAQYQIKTCWFLLICLFSTIQMLKINYFVATIASQYQYIFKSYELAAKLNKFFDVALPLGGIISVPLIGILLDNYSSLFVVSTLLTISLLIGILGFFSNYALAVVGVCLFVGYRPMFYTVISDLCAKVYGFETFGTVYGSIMTISGVFNYGQSYLDELTHTVFDMDPMPVNLVLLLATLVVGGFTVGTVFGVQEFWSTVFSLGNLYVNFKSFKVIYRELKKLSTSKKHQGEVPTVVVESRILYWQSILLLTISCIGWCFSSIFHFRDTASTEVLDYFGAFAIILCNLNIIVVRFFKLYKLQYQLRLALWQLSLVVIYAYHIVRLFIDWDYSYNMNINVVAGLSAMVLWFLHSFNVGRIYNKNINLVQNTITLVPYETSILKKLLHLREDFNYGNTTRSKKLSLMVANLSRWIAYIPVFNNLVLLCGLYLEINDFAPWFRLVDAHSLWHLLTIFPSYIWFDWNVWDVEMSKVTGTL